MKFKKEKLKSISHSDKMWWIRAAPTSRAVILINKVLKKFDPQIKCGLDDYYFEECGLKFTPNYSSWKK